MRCQFVGNACQVRHTPIQPVSTPHNDNIEVAVSCVAQQPLEFRPRLAGIG